MQSKQPVFLGAEEETRPLLGLVDGTFSAGTPVTLSVQINDQAGQPITGDSPDLYYSRLDGSGREVRSGYLGEMELKKEGLYVYGLKESDVEKGLYEFEVVTNRGGKKRIRLLFI